MTAPNEISRTRGRALDVACTFLFLAALALPTLDEFVRTDVARGPGPELRVPGPRPSRPFTWNDAKEYPSRYEAYYRDSFGLRDALLRWNSLVKHYVYRVGTSPLLVPDGLDWINYDGDRTLANARGVVPFTEEELEAWRARLEEREAALRALGIRYLFAIIPNKETIYPERVPARFNSIGPTRLDQLVDWLDSKSTARIFDLRPSFLAEKAHDEPTNFLYNPLGTHWGGRGACLAYRVLVGRMREWFPATRILEDGEFKLIEGGEAHDTWATSMYIPDVLLQRERWIQVRPDLRASSKSLEEEPRRRLAYSTPRTDGPRLLIYHDSFMGAIEYALAATVPALEVVAGPRFDLKAIAAARPDAVIELFVERLLVYLPILPPGSRPPQPRFTTGAPDLEVAVLSSTSETLASCFEDGIVEIGENRSASTVWFATSGHERYSVAVGLELATDSFLDVYWRSAPGEPYLRSRRLTIPVPAGTTIVREFLGPFSGKRGQLLLRARENHRPVPIRSIEIRASKH